MWIMGTNIQAKALKRTFSTIAFKDLCQRFLSKILLTKSCSKMLFKDFQRFFFKCCVCGFVSLFGGLFRCLLPRHVLCCLLVACKVLTDNKAHALAKFCKMHQKPSERHELS